MSGGGARPLQSHEAEASPSVNISARRMGEDLETIKSRLIDREFNISMILSGRYSNNSRVLTRATQKLPILTLILL